MEQRIENTTIGKNIKLFKWLAAFFAALLVVRLIFSPEILHGTGSTTDFLLSSAPLVFIVAYLIAAKKRGQQFIEWTEDSVNYRTGSGQEKRISMKDIASVRIEMDRIVVHCKNGSTIVVDISEFQEYEDRIKIKDNFSKIAKDHGEKQYHGHGRRYEH